LQYIERREERGVGQVREIKFRAWNKDEKKMWGHDLMHKNRLFALSDFLPHQDFLVIPNGKHIILMQYTGLKDKNGKEIFEGDILTNGKFNCQIYWENGQWRWQRLDANDSLYIYLLVNKNKVEIIGNIYENPELLNDQRPDQD
jgi:hypothetical protein